MPRFKSEFLRLRQRELMTHSPAGAMATFSPDPQQLVANVVTAFDRPCIVRGLRCYRLTFSRQAPSSRLVRRAQDRSRCSRDFHHGLLELVQARHRQPGNDSWSSFNPWCRSGFEPGSASRPSPSVSGGPPFRGVRTSSSPPPPARGKRWPPFSAPLTGSSVRVIAMNSPRKPRSCTSRR